MLHARSRRPQDARRLLQAASKTRPDAANTPEDAAKTPQDAPKKFQDASRTLSFFEDTHRYTLVNIRPSLNLLYTLFYCGDMVTW